MLLLFLLLLSLSPFFFFFFNDTATTEIYTLSLHDALPILRARANAPRTARRACPVESAPDGSTGRTRQDRKSTRLNSSHSQISYAVFCLKKKKKTRKESHNHYLCIYHTQRVDISCVSTI